MHGSHDISTFCTNGTLGLSASGGVHPHVICTTNFFRVTVFLQVISQPTLKFADNPIVHTKMMKIVSIKLNQING